MIWNLCISIRLKDKIEEIYANSIFHYLKNNSLFFFFFQDNNFTHNKLSLHMPLPFLPVPERKFTVSLRQTSFIRLNIRDEEETTFAKVLAAVQVSRFDVHAF